MRYLFLLLALPLSIPASAFAKDDATVENPDKVRCRAIKEVGSRIPKRVCKSNAEWAREQAEARAAMANRNRASRCSGDFC